VNYEILILSIPKQLQAEKATVADAVYHWIQIMRQMEPFDDGLDKLETKMDEALCPRNCAPYLLHPTYRGMRKDPFTNSC
jgi:hypothetical protein